MVLLKEGLAPVEVARRLGVDRRSVRRWKAAQRQGGRQALKAKPAPGRPAKLDPAAKARLEKILLRGASAAGFSTDLWTCRRVAELIATRFGVRYHVRHLPRLLRSLGWSPQKPQRRGMERHEAAIQAWVRSKNCAELQK
jgi:transposase